MKAIDCEHRDFPVCPHCGTIDEDWWDGLTIEARDGSEWTAKCPECGEEYHVTLTVTTTFTTKKTEPTGPEEKP